MDNYKSGVRVSAEMEKSDMKWILQAILVSFLIDHHGSLTELGITGGEKLTDGFAMNIQAVFIPLAPAAVAAKRIPAAPTACFGNDAGGGDKVICFFAFQHF